MIKQIRRRLTLICALGTSAILLAMTCLCLYLSENRLREKSFQTFCSSASGLLTYLEEQSVITHSWLSRMEYHYQCAIDLLDNGQPLLYRSLHSRDDFALFDLAREAAAQEYALDVTAAHTPNRLSRHAEFSLRADSGIRWYASVALIPKNGGTLNAVILSSQEPLANQLRHQRILFGLGCAVALTLLTFLMWIVIGQTLRPAEESRQKQIAFVASASHELRSPLAVMLTSLTAMRKSTGTQAIHFADIIEREGNRMSRLISDMLTLAAADSRSWSIQPAAQEADTLLLQVYETYESLARQSGHTLAIVLPEDPLPALFCDAQRITQCLAILIENALAYTPEGSSVELALYAPETAGRQKTRRPRYPFRLHLPFSDPHFSSEAYCTFAVIDHGFGIPDEKKASVFERFYRADDAHADRQHFGLGLCIAKEIAALHKGSLRVGDTPGGGATFLLKLPLM